MPPTPAHRHFPKFHPDWLSALGFCLLSEQLVDDSAEPLGGTIRVLVGSGAHVLLFKEQALAVSAGR